MLVTDDLLRLRIGSEADNVPVQFVVVARADVAHADIRKRTSSLRRAFADLAEQERRRLHVANQEPPLESA